MLVTEIDPLHQDEAEHIINGHLNLPFAQEEVEFSQLYRRPQSMPEKPLAPYPNSVWGRSTKQSSAV